jgi:hypothetical protein
VGSKTLSSKEVTLLSHPHVITMLWPEPITILFPLYADVMSHGWRLEEMLEYWATNSMPQTSHRGLVDALTNLEVKEFWTFDSMLNSFQCNIHYNVYRMPSTCTYRWGLKCTTQGIWLCYNWIAIIKLKWAWSQQGYTKGIEMLFWGCIQQHNNLHYS